MLEVIIKAPIFSVLYQRLTGSGSSKNEQEFHLWSALKCPYKKGFFFLRLTFLLTLAFRNNIIYCFEKRVSLLSLIAVNFLFTAAKRVNDGKSKWQQLPAVNLNTIEFSHSLHVSQK